VEKIEQRGDRMPNRRRAPRNEHKKNSFGGYQLNFAGQIVTMEQLFGEKTLPVGKMLSTLWAYAKAHELASKSRPYQPRRVRKADLKAALIEPDA
jgi:hypothetical protein